MEPSPYRLPLYLPAQGASETEATIIEWRVAEGDRFQSGQVLAQIDSAKSVFDFEAPCAGQVIHLLRQEGETSPLAEPVMEIETSDPAMRDWIPPAVTGTTNVECQMTKGVRQSSSGHPSDGSIRHSEDVVIMGVGGYLPSRVVTNAELVRGFPELTDQYVYEVTGIRQRRWADDNERPSGMAFKAALEAIRNSGIDTRDIDAIIVATTTPDMAIPSTAAVLQDRLSLPTVPAFDLNAACSGWLYAVANARGMILSGLARHVLTVGVEMQSRLLDAADRNAYFLFADGAGAAIVSAGDSQAGAQGHRIRHVHIGGDTRGIQMARRDAPGYLLPNGHGDPWIRIDGHAMFRFATESFSTLIRDAVAKSGWQPDDARWVIPHQANGRILKAAAKRSGIPFDRFFINIENIGNTSSASIPLALTDVQRSLRPDDKLVLCSVGAGLTTAAITVEW